jgi:nitrogen regulatory protein PII
MKYTKMTVITRREKYDLLRETLESENISGFTVTPVEGNGQQLGEIRYKDGDRFQTTLIPKIMVEAMYHDIDTETVIRKVCAALRTNIMGDGKIFIEEIEGSVFKIRTGEQNENAF